MVVVVFKNDKSIVVVVVVGSSSTTIIVFDSVCKFSAFSSADGPFSSATAIPVNINIDNITINNATSFSFVVFNKISLLVRVTELLASFLYLIYKIYSFTRLEIGSVKYLKISFFTAFSKRRDCSLEKYPLNSSSAMR